MDDKNKKSKIKQYCISRASDARHMLLVFAILTLNIYFALTGFLDEDNVFTAVSKVIMQYSWIVFILLVGALLYFDTYINRHTSRKISFGIAGTYLAIFAEARFVIKQEFDICFSILLMVIVALPSIQDLVETKKKQDDNESANSYAPVTKDLYLFKSRKRQQEYLINLFQNKSIVNKGMSICIKGKWGSGKTSFINTTLDRMKNEEEIEFEEIRINALELEDTSALIKYYFTRIKEILEKKNAYVGIKSEYRALVNSLLKSATSENLSEYIMNTFEEDEDYRSIISEISEVLKDALCNCIIIIIVDDIERCSDNKIKQLIFFIKEIATMKRCISIFLVDDLKLYKNCGLGDDTSSAAEFVDKFFDEVITLRNISISESIERFDDDIFEKHINSLIEYFDKRIENVEGETVIGTNHSQEFEEEKKKKLEDVKAKAQIMKIMFSNPRRLKKIHTFYYRYRSAIEDEIKSMENETKKQEELTLFLNNIDYTKQLLLISILQDSFNEQYNQVVNEKIDSVIKYLPNECWLKAIIRDEWFPLISNYFTSQKLSFSDAIIQNDYNAILNMVNPFSNMYDEYKNSITEGKIPQKDGTDISITDCFEVIYKTNGYESDLMIKMFEVYKSKTSFDEALTVFYSNSVAHARDIALVEFADICCTSNYKIDNVETCRERFERIYPKVLWKLLIDFKAYFCHHDLRIDRDVEEAVFNNPSFSDSINQYVTKIASRFNFRLSSSDPVDKLREILDNMKAYYISKNYPVQAADFQNLFKYSQTALERIKALSRIEEYINSSHDVSTSVNNTIMQDITEIRNIIKQQKEKNERFLNYDGFRDFMKKVERNGLSPEEKEEFKKMTEELSDIDLSYSIWARQLLFELESQVENTEE